jgi:hypothetical protein
MRTARLQHSILGIAASTGRCRRNEMAQAMHPE